LYRSEKSFITVIVSFSQQNGVSAVQQVFSPRQVARAIGASESSVKRWCDNGLLPTVKTAGGHRRLPIQGIIDFLRTDRHTLVRPEELGLPAKTGARSISMDAAIGLFRIGIGKGDLVTCNRLLLDLRLSGHSLASICDHVIATSMHEMGDAWCSGEVEIYEERRGCEIAMRLMHEMRSTLSKPAPDAPIAYGASAESDPYALPTRMVELVLIELGWNAISMGCGIPIESLIKAIEKDPPRLFWLSISSVKDPTTFIQQFERLHEVCGDKTALVVGGRGLTEPIREKIRYTAHCDNLQRLESFAKAIHPPGN